MNKSNQISSTSGICI